MRGISVLSLGFKPGKQGLTGNPSFTWLAIGFFCSMLGDQFSLIALPWLVLKLTEDAVALGTVLALIGVPRALFILVGGAVVDHYSPKKIIIVSNCINAALLIVLAVLVLSDSIHLSMLYIISLALGIATAFTIPASNSIIPQVVAPAQLQAANSIVMIARQMTLFAGPLLAGIFITLLGTGADSEVVDATGIGIVFLLDAVTFLICVWTFRYVKTIKCMDSITSEHSDWQSIVGSIADGINTVWADYSLRTVLFFIAMIGIFVAGPLQVGLPVMANTINSQAIGFGVLVATYGVGVLAGMVVSGMKPGLGMNSLGITVVVSSLVLGALVAGLAFVGSIAVGAVLLLAAGLLAGFVQVGIYTWIQQQVDQRVMGRTMSILMFCYIGLVPVTAALSGWIISYFSLKVLFACAGCILFTLALAGMLNPNVRAIGRHSVR